MPAEEEEEELGDTVVGPPSSEIEGEDDDSSDFVTRFLGKTLVLRVENARFHIIIHSPRI